ncbi:MAG: hypothetical protein Q8O52_08105, partial [Sulfuritalea sp.]|nr:hypothetical protein [Sulfuritalea sp.]
SRVSFMSITILVMINPLLNSPSEFFRQAHSSLEIRPAFRLIPRWIRLLIAHSEELADNARLCRFAKSTSRACT